MPPSEYLVVVDRPSSALFATDVSSPETFLAIPPPTYEVKVAVLVSAHIHAWDDEVMIAGPSSLALTATHAPELYIVD